MAGDNVIRRDTEIWRSMAPISQECAWIDDELTFRMNLNNQRKIDKKAKRKKRQKLFGKSYLADDTGLCLLRV